MVSDSKSKHGGFYRKGPAVRQIGLPVKVDDWTDKIVEVFSILCINFFIAYQGTTRAIRNDQREQMYVCYIDHGFYNLNLVVMILKLSRSFIKLYTCLWGSSCTFAYHY